MSFDFVKSCPCGEDDCNRLLDFMPDEKGARVSIHNGQVTMGGMPLGDISQTVISFEALKELRDKIDEYLKGRE